MRISPAGHRSRACSVSQSQRAIRPSFPWPRSRTVLAVALAVAGWKSRRPAVKAVEEAVALGFFRLVSFPSAPTGLSSLLSETRRNWWEHCSWVLGSVFCSADGADQAADHRTDFR